MTGLDKVAKAIAVARGWPWCDEHDRPRLYRVGSLEPCDGLHDQPWSRSEPEEGWW